MTNYTVMRKGGNVYAVSDEGDMIPVTNVYDEYGDECELEEASVVIAGPTKKGKWLRITVTPGPLEIFH